MKRRTKEEYDNVMKLLGENKSVKEISKLTGISNRTIRYWKDNKHKTSFKKSEFLKILDTTTDEQLQSLIDNTTSLSALTIKLGKPGDVKFYTDMIRERINNGVFDLSKMKQNLKDMIKLNSTKHYVFDVNSPTPRKAIKKYILDNNIFKNECAICAKPPINNNLPLVMQLDHINGIHNDNRLINLRLLCPDCHSQQVTSYGRNKKQKIKTKTLLILKDNNSYCSCGNKKSIRAQICTNCHSKNRNKKFDLTKEQLEKLVKEKPMTEIGKMFGVSSNSIKKRCKRLGIELKDMRGYWQKIKANK